jgi:type I restriction enzyme S subunit
MSRKGWRECKLGDVIEFQRGYDLTQTDFISGEIPVAGSNGIIGYHNNFTTIGPGITIGRSGNSIGTPIYYDSNFWAHNTVLYVKNFKGNNTRFIFYFLCQIDFSSFNAGSAVPTLNRNHLYELPVCLPSLSEQQDIASILSSLDQKIGLLYRQNKTLEAMAEALFRQRFVEEADDSWVFKPLKEVVDISIGRTPPRKEYQWFSKNSDDIKWVSIKDMGNAGVFIFKTDECLTRTAIETFNIPVIPKDTVLLSFKMTIGRVCIAAETMLSNEAIAHFVLKEVTPFPKEYLYLFLKGYKFEALGSTSSIVSAINSAMIKEIMIPIPDRVKMDGFSSMTVPVFNGIKHNETEIHRLKDMRDMLLPRLMGGEVKVG